MDGPDIPSFFICPISLQIMKDPVTISTGMTYERESIQKWLLTYNNKSCPVTKQILTDQNLTPNSTLLRLIESWSINYNYNNGARARARSSEKVIDPPSKPTLDFSVLLQKIIEDYDQVSSTDDPSSHIEFLRKIKVLVQENDNNGVYILETHALSLVVNIITSSSDELEKKSTHKDLSYDCSSSGDVEKPTPRANLLTPFIGSSTQQTWASSCHTGPHNEKSKIVEEAISVLYLLKPSNETLKQISQDNYGLLMRSLSFNIQHGSYQARIEAALLLKSIFKVVDDNYKADLHIDLFEGITEILKDQNSNQAIKVVLSILIQLLQFPKNGIKAVKVGVVWVLVEILAESRENKRNIEIMLGVLEQLCRTAEGRSAFLAHPASVATISSKILMVSQTANEKAVKILVLICRFCKNCWVVQELMEVGCVAKLFMVVQAECSLKTKEKAKEILGFHIKTWNKSPCFSTCFKV